MHRQPTHNPTRIMPWGSAARAGSKKDSPETRHTARAVLNHRYLAATSGSASQ